jgi:hypothetical protein
MAHLAEGAPEGTLAVVALVVAAYLAEGLLSFHLIYVFQVVQ